MALSAGATKTPRHFISAVIFFVIVFVITIGVYGYKGMIESKNNDLLSSIKNLQTTIGTLRKDEDIQAYELYDKNSKQLNNMSYLSDIPNFYEEIMKIKRKYNLNFSNFGYSKGIITVSTMAQSDSSEEGYVKLEQLISDFRTSDKNLEEGEEKEESIFDLEFVNSFLGSSTISSNLTFSLKPQKIEKKIEEEVTTKKTEEQENVSEKIIEATTKQ